MTSNLCKNLLLPLSAFGRRKIAAASTVRVAKLLLFVIRFAVWTFWNFCSSFDWIWLEFPVNFLAFYVRFFVTQNGRNKCKRKRIDSDKRHNLNLRAHVTGIELVQNPNECFNWRWRLTLLCMLAYTLRAAKEAAPEVIQRDEEMKV